MVDVSIVNGIMNQLITGGHHPVHVWIVRPMVLSGPGRSGPAEILSGKFHGDDMPTCESVLTHHSEDQLASGYARVYIYIYYGCIIKENWWIKQNENMRLVPINMGFNMIFDDLANKVWNN